MDEIAVRRLGYELTGDLLLRQPSMNPTIVDKGGATGSGYSQVVPIEDSICT